jgi:hypothetical protein
VPRTPARRSNNTPPPAFSPTPAGRWPVGFAEIIVIVVGVGMIVYGARRSFEKKPLTHQMTRHVRNIVVHLGQLGYIAKGVALGIVGMLLFDVALLDDVARTSGMDAAPAHTDPPALRPAAADPGRARIRRSRYLLFCQSKYRKFSPQITGR